MAIKEFRLPDLGEGLTESEVVAWRVAVGDRVALNQVIAEVETAKALVEVPSPFSGVVARLHADAGVTVAVGAPLVSFEVADAAGASGASGVSGAPPMPDDAAADGEPAPPNLVGYGAVAEKSGAPIRRRRTIDFGAAVGGVLAAEAVAAAEAVVAAEAVDERPRSTPPVRKLAAQLEVRLEDVVGSGERGLVTRADVERAAAGGIAAPDVAAPAPVADPATASGEHRIPVTGVRRLTAEATVASAFTAPHVTLFLTVDVTRTLELLAELRQTPPFREVRLTFLTAVARAVCLAMRRHDQINARWDADGGDIIRYDRVNLGIAAATPRGLLVPVLREADRLDLIGLAGGLSELVTVAKAGTTTPAALRGGTFTITNVGVFGVDAGTPILNDGEAAILAVGATAQRPWAHEGQLALRDVVTLSLSIDHRVLDGEQGARFLAEVGGLLSDPARAFAVG